MVRQDVFGGAARVSAGLVTVESAPDFLFLELFFFLNRLVNPLKTLSEALSSLFMALLDVLLAFVTVLFSADSFTCWGIVLKDWSAADCAFKPLTPETSSRTRAGHVIKRQ